MRTVLRISILLLLTSAVRAQTAREELLRINTLYAQAKAFSMQIDVAVYDKAEDQIPLQQFKGEVRRRPDAYYTSLMGHTTLVNSTCQIIIDEVGKIIYIDANNPNTDQLKAPAGDLTTLLDSALMPNQQISIAKKTAEQNTLELTTTGTSNIKRTLIKYHPTTYIIQQVMYFYDETDADAVGKAVITYSQVVLGTTPDAALFSEKKYITHKAGVYSPTPAYAGYRIVDITNQVKPPRQP